MRADDIVFQLKKWIPEFTDKFNTSIDVSSISVVNGLCTVTTVEPHYLFDNDEVYIRNAELRIKITNISKDSPTSTIATITTSSYHNVVKGDTLNVTVEGVSDILYNGTLEVIKDIDAYNFTVKVDESASQSPDVTNANLVTVKKQTINGWKTITVIDETSFSYQEGDTSLNLTSDNTGIEVVKDSRIFPCLDEEESLQMYCDYFSANKDEPSLEDINIKDDDEFSLFVCVRPEVRNTGTTDRSEGYYLNRFSLFIYAPTKDSYMYEGLSKCSDLTSYVFNRILGQKPLNTYNQFGSRVTGPVKYISSGKMGRVDTGRVVYPHTINYEFITEAVNSDFSLPFDSVRLNEIITKQTSKDNEYIVSSAKNSF